MLGYNTISMHGLYFSPILNSFQSLIQFHYHKNCLKGGNFNESTYSYRMLVVFLLLKYVEKGTVVSA